MNLEHNLKQKLTDDSKAQVLIDNYGELLEKGLCERNYGYEEYIKLNRLERLMTPEKPDILKTTKPFHGTQIVVITYYCPNCRAKSTPAPYLLHLHIKSKKHCSHCGQALDWSEVKE